MKFEGTKTEQNLLAAFAGESQARNKYTYFASVAKKEGYEQKTSLTLPRWMSGSKPNIPMVLRGL